MYQMTVRNYQRDENNEMEQYELLTSERHAGVHEALEDAKNRTADTEGRVEVIIHKCGVPALDTIPEQEAQRKLLGVGVQAESAQARYERALERIKRLQYTLDEIAEKADRTSRGV